MSMIESLTEIRDNLTYSLRYCNEALLEKGGEAAETLHVVGEKIAALPSGGDDELARIALQAPTDEELRTAEIKLDSSWGDLRPYAFYKNTKLKSVDLSECENMTEISNYCFQGSSLNTIKFPANITRIGDCAFKDSKLKEINLPQNVKTIGAECFYGVGSIKSLTIPKSVKTIGGSAFRAFHYLDSLTFEEDSELLTLGGRTFSDAGYGNVTKIDFGITSKLNKFSGYELYNRSKLEEVWMSPCLKTFGGYGNLQNCPKLKAVYFRSTPTVMYNTNTGQFPSQSTLHIYFPCSEECIRSLGGFPWGATNATFHFDWKAFEHIEITTPPDKVEYSVDHNTGEVEPFDPTGMVVTAYDAEGNPTVIDDYFYSDEEFAEAVNPVGNFTFYIYAIINGNKHITYLDLASGV